MSHGDLLWIPTSIYLGWENNPNFKLHHILLYLTLTWVSSLTLACKVIEMIVTCSIIKAWFNITLIDFYITHRPWNIHILSNLVSSKTSGLEGFIPSINSSKYRKKDIKLYSPKKYYLFFPIKHISAGSKHAKIWSRSTQRITADSW